MSAADWAAIRPNLAKVAEAADWWDILHGHVEQAAAPEDRAYLAAAAAAAAAIDWSDAPWPALTARLKETSGRSGKALFHPLRRALTGRDSGPGNGRRAAADRPRRGDRPPARRRRMISD